MAPPKTVTLDSRTNGLAIGAISYGAMNHTWTPKPSSQDKVDGALDAALSRGGPVMLNTGTFYGNPDNPTSNLDAIGDWMRRNEDRASQFVVSVKGGMDMSKHAPDTSESFLRKEIEDAAKRLAPAKIAIFECARVDKSRPQEEVMKTLLKLRDEGLFQHIGLSECSAETIRKSHAVAPIAGVEVEYSPWSLDIERNGVLSTCQELGIAILAYSPLGKGFLTGSIRSHDDLPENDMRRNFDRFQPDVFDQNLKIVDEISELAKKKGVTNAQLVLAWLISVPGVVPIPGSTRAEGVTESLGAYDVKLSEEDIAALRKVIDNANVKGLRYNKQMEGSLEG